MAEIKLRAKIRIGELVRELEAEHLFSGAGILLGGNGLSVIEQALAHIGST